MLYINSSSSTRSVYRALGGGATPRTRLVHRPTGRVTAVAAAACYRCALLLSVREAFTAVRRCCQHPGNSFQHGGTYIGRWVAASRRKHLTA